METQSPKSVTLYAYLTDDGELSEISFIPHKIWNRIVSAELPSDKSISVDITTELDLLHSDWKPYHGTFYFEQSLVSLVGLPLASKLSALMTLGVEDAVQSSIRTYYVWSETWNEGKLVESNKPDFGQITVDVNKILETSLDGIVD